MPAPLFNNASGSRVVGPREGWRGWSVGISVGEGLKVQLAPLTEAHVS